jgi:hypothetical protein
MCELYDNSTIGMHSINPLEGYLAHGASVIDS